MREHTYKTMPEEKKEETFTPKEGEMDEQDTKIMKEIEESKKTKEEESNKKETDSPEDEVKKEEETKSKEKLEDKDKKEEKKEEKSETQERTPKVIELYKHKIAEKKWNKEKEEFLSTIKKLEGNPKKDTKEISKDVDAKIKQFAKDNKMDVSVLKGILDLVAKPKEDTSLRTDIDKMKSERIAQQQSARFDKDFDKTIVPILEKAKISKDDYKDIKQSLHDKAFTKELAKTPIDMIFRGDKFFDRFKPSNSDKKGFESGKKGLKGDKDIKDKTPKEMTSKEFDEYEKELDVESKGRGIEIRREGKSITV